MRRVHHFLRDEQGQDYVEYALLLTFVVLGSAAIFLKQGDSIKAIWSVTADNLKAACSVAK